MSRYLDVAEEVLRIAKQPLNSRQIFGTALQLNLIPPDLFGKTQHKTLQARLSQDILKHRSQSRFYRTARGVFFLRHFLHDPNYTAPREVFARRRVRDLRFKSILSVRKRLSLRSAAWLKGSILSQNISKHLFYQDYSTPVEGSTRVWACSVIRRERKYLSYRRGAFRETRDTFLNQRSIGFYGPIVRDDKDLFGQSDEGLMKAVIEITAIDLDMPLDTGWTYDSRFVIVGTLVTSSLTGVQDALSVVRIDVPGWFEPPRHKLSINDLSWIELDEINDIDAFDPWSKQLLQHLAKGEVRVDDTKNEGPTPRANR